MRSQLLPALALTLLAAAGTPVRADDPLVEKVRKSIDDGKRYLLGQKRENGSWEVGAATVTYPGGTTSLVLLALLTAGVPPSDPVIQDGLKYLRTIDLEAGSKTYVVGLQTMAYAQAGQAVDRERIQKNITWLQEARKANGWSYGRLGDPDNSNSQYAVLGLHAGIESGLRVDKKALEAIRKFMVDSQIPKAMPGRPATGGWAYKERNPASMTMTCAGLCNLMITGMDLDVGKQHMEGGVIKDCGVYDEDGPAANALRWIGGAFPDELQVGNAASRLGPAQFYALYGIERTGRMTGRRFFGGNDWYEIGCRYLVGIQKGDGAWQGIGNLDGSPVVATSFALLFLAKGRTPVLLTKLAYGPRDYDGWNNKHSDARHLVDFASRVLFKRQPLAWQIFDVRGGVRADTAADRRRLAEELLPSPIVYFNGHDFAPPDPRERDILKQYVENGGFILAEACCGRNAFQRSFEKLIDDILPGSELKRLPDDHPIWTASGKFLLTPNKPFPLYGVQHGCKWVAIFSPMPLAYHWEANDFDRNEDGKLAFQLAANIIAYATGLEPPRPRLSAVEIPRDDGRERVRRGYLKVAQLRRGGDWQPAPKAMRNLMSEVRKIGLDVVLEPTPVYPSVEKVVRYRFLYMHGRTAFEERPKDLKPLHFNLTSGGLLLADACCGSPSFDASFRKFMDVLWAEEKLKLEPIPLSDELLGKELNGEQIKVVRCRRPRADGKGVDPEYRLLPPALEGVKYNGRWVVIYSKYDLGCALEHTTSSDCLGHDYDSAVRLGRAAVLYALRR
jgi:hypothetical protein